MKKETEGSNMKVMVVIDESEYSYHALMWVLDNLTEVITGSSLVLFAVQSTPNCNYTFAAQLGMAGLYFPVFANLDLITNIQEKNKKVSLGILEKAKDICANRGVKAETITELGDPKVLICNTVQKHKINLLVIGNRTVGALKRAFLGSLSDYCLNNAGCPVLVVKKQG